LVHASQRVWTAVSGEVATARYKSTARAEPLARLQHIELVELGDGAIVGDVPGGEPGKLAADHREVAPAVVAVEEPFEHGQRVAALEHVVDLVVGDDPRVVRAPDHAREA